MPGLEHCTEKQTFGEVLPSQDLVLPSVQKNHSIWNTAGYIRLVQDSIIQCIEQWPPIHECQQGGGRLGFASTRNVPGVELKSGLLLLIVIEGRLGKVKGGRFVLIRGFNWVKSVICMLIWFQYHIQNQNLTLKGLDIFETKFIMATVVHLMAKTQKRKLFQNCMLIMGPLQYLESKLGFKQVRYQEVG